MPPIFDRIAAAHDQHAIGTGAERVHRTMAARMGLLAQTQLFIPTEVAAENHAVHVTVNDSRWVIVCPDCGEGQLAARDDPRFCCWECKNVMVEGRWRPVIWPNNADEIAHELLKRPYRDGRGIGPRNWHPGETVADLAIEAINQHRPSTPRLEDLDERDRERVTALVTANTPHEQMPVVEWADAERTTPKVTFPKKGKS